MRVVALGVAIGAAPAAACDVTFIEPRHVAAAGLVEAGLIRGPGCATAATIELFLKEQTPGLDRTLARARRTFRDGRIDLVPACGRERRMKLYLQMGSPPDRRKTAPTVIEGCG